MVSKKETWGELGSYSQKGPPCCVGLAFAERTEFGAEACENSTGAGSTLFTGVSTVLDPRLTWNGDKTSFLAGRKIAGGEEEH